SNGANHNVFRNLVIALNKNNQNQTIAVHIKPLTVPDILEGSTNDNKFFNNRILNTSIAYFFEGNTSVMELMPVGNEIGGTFGESIISDLVLCGVYIKDQNGFQLSNTIIRNLERIGDGTTAPAAISTVTGGSLSVPVTNPIVISNNKIDSIVSNTTSVFGVYLSAKNTTHIIDGNIITNIYANGGGSNTADGITLMGTGIDAYIINNMISAVSAPASAVSGNSATRGINVRTYKYARLYHNSVLLDYQASNSGNYSAALCVYNNNDTVDIRNNVFVNRATLPDGATGRVCAMFKRTPSLSNIALSSDNNIYFAGQPSSSHPIFYGHSTTDPAIDTTLESYKTRAQYFDQSSLTENIPFLSLHDLHISPEIQSQVRGNAQYLYWVDIDNQPRDPQAPDIGADEIVFLRPNHAINLIPQNNDTIPVFTTRDTTTKVSFDFFTDYDYLLPQSIIITQTDSTGTQVIKTTTFPYSEGQTHYEFNVEDVFVLDCDRPYQWMVETARDSLTSQSDRINFFVDCIVEVGFDDHDVNCMFYPNPVGDWLTISTNNNGKIYRLQIIDLSGRTAIEKKDVTGSFQIQVSDWPQGVYLLRLIDEGSIFLGYFYKK
ncbi:MAG TPA: T9SS type A sorting domain-containing protein, partial [Salinivirgaceae bacterium]|nr:T9SS type A sorting domain-containing protein [Salinivirgaceae bacterium]